jgi:DNA-directed RNA polymerase subunit alpha
MKVVLESKLMVLSIQDALTEAAKVLIHHFMLFSDEKITLEG